MRKYLVAFIFLVGVVVASQVNSGRLLADVGPTPISAQGGMVQPSVTTNVSMQAEKVTLTYSAPKAGSDQQKVMDVHVTAAFTMVNSGAAENIKVYFPSTDASFVDGYPDKTISNFTVNGTALTTLVDVPAGFGGAGNTIQAYQWQQSFPSGTTTLNISYDSQTSSKYGQFYLTYVLGTGRNWAGNIGHGEIDFVLPLTTVPPYGVTAKPPLLKASSLPYALSGNTIKVTFDNYEPAADAAISLGVSDIDTLQQISQKLAIKDQTFDSTLQVANLFRSVSMGPHCTVCVEPAAAQADHYYNLALEKATGKDDLNKVIQAYAWGDDPSATFEQLLRLFTYFKNHQACADTDETCWENERSFIGGTPFGFNANGVVSHADFLATYACRIRPYDSATAATVEAYAGKKLATCPVPTAAAPASPSNNQTKPATTNNNTPWLLIGLIASGVALVLAGLTAWLIVRHRRAMHSAPTAAPAPAALQPQQDTVVQPALELAAEPKPAAHHKHKK